MARTNNIAKFVPVLISAAAAVLCTALFGKKRKHEKLQENAAFDDGRQPADSNAGPEVSSDISPSIHDGGREAQLDPGMAAEDTLKALIKNASMMREELGKGNEAISSAISIQQRLQTATPAEQAKPSAPTPPNDEHAGILSGDNLDFSGDWASSGSSDGSFIEVVDLPPPVKLTDADREFFRATLASGASDGQYVKALPHAKPTDEAEAQRLNARMNAIRLSAFQGAQLGACLTIDPDGDAWTPALEEARNRVGGSMNDERQKPRRQQIVYDLDDV